MFEVEALPAFNDNYIWLIKNNNSKQCAVVDPGDATPVLNWLKQNPSWQLVNIFITHHHADHTGGIEQLKSMTAALVAAPQSSAIPLKDHILTNDQVINLVGRATQIISVPGHTLDHIAFYTPSNKTEKESWLFCGDTLFAGGCGRVFEGTMEQMYHSLQRLNSLPIDTLIYSAHEYTINNLYFALAVEPNNSIIQNRLAHCIQLREQQKSTLPSTLRVERETNPFLRCNLHLVKLAAESHIGQQLQTEIDVFKILREWKNNFKVAI